MQPAAKVVAHLLAASIIGAVAAAAAARYSRRRLKRSKPPPPKQDPSFIPSLERRESGRIRNLERFSDYVARQLGFTDASEIPQLSNLAYNYLKKSKTFEASIYEYFADDPTAETLCVKLIEELERCILTYFAFHWSQASEMISQVLSVECDEKKTKLKDFVMAATRQQRFDRVMKDLKVTRVFSTLVEEMKAIKRGDEPKCTEVMVPVAHNKRSPVLLLMGGGMGAGKSTVLKDIMKEPFWSGATEKAVVVEADAFKETDVIYRAISSRGHHHDMLHTAELVHSDSTAAASSLLVTALNEGRDVIMDGTLSWEPFVEQTIAMARNVHKTQYRMGGGYKVQEDGTITENYWEQVLENGKENGDVQSKKLPYRIELVGVLCDPYLAVVRGIRRAIMVRRAVRVNSQLNSHKRFANAFPKYCDYVDNARLYSTNSVGGPVKLIGWKDGQSNLLVDQGEIELLTTVGGLNHEAESVYELYSDPEKLYQPGSVWNDNILTPLRPIVQLELKNAIMSIENSSSQIQ